MHKNNLLMFHHDVISQISSEMWSTTKTARNDIARDLENVQKKAHLWQMIKKGIWIKIVKVKSNLMEQDKGTYMLSTSLCSISGNTVSSSSRNTSSYGLRSGSQLRWHIVDQSHQYYNNICTLQIVFTLVSCE